MVNNFPGCNMLWCKIYRSLFLLFLAFFAISPIVDAYADSSCSPVVFFNDLNDSDSPDSINNLKLNDARKSLPALNRASKQKNDNRSRLQPTSLKDGQAGRLTGPQLPAKDNCSSQRCSLASSDSSPPVI
jgi:hypothetical protein